MRVQTGPPPRQILRDRTRRFLALAAAGERFDRAADKAGLTAGRALSILADLGPEGVVALLDGERQAA